MFGCDDHEYLSGQLDVAKALLRAEQSGQSVLADALGDIFAFTEPVPHRYPWEGSQTEHYASGLEAKLMDELKRLGCIVRQIQIVADKALRGVGLDPKTVGSAAAAKRKADEKRRRAAELRAEADALEAEAGK